jgi:hypothetical protein
MNERIKELADEAGFMDSWFSESGDDCQRELKKFAELIIQECVTKMALEIMDKQWVDDAVKNTYDYFGIKSE